MPKILIADDSADLLDAFEYVLTIYKHEVYKADCIETFFDLLREITPDIILMDVKFCKADGRLLCHRVSKSTGGKIPIILMSGSHELLEDYKLFGASTIIEKPFSTKEVVALISLYVENSTTIPSLV